MPPSGSNPSHLLWLAHALSSSQGDTVAVLEAPVVRDGTFVRVVPYADDVQNVKGDLIDTLLG